MSEFPQLSSKYPEYSAANLYYRCYLGRQLKYDSRPSCKGILSTDPIEYCQKAAKIFADRKSTSDYAYKTHLLLADLYKAQNNIGRANYHAGIVARDLTTKQKQDLYTFPAKLPEFGKKMCGCSFVETLDRDIPILDSEEACRKECCGFNRDTEKFHLHVLSEISDGSNASDAKKLESYLALSEMYLCIDEFEEASRILEEMKDFPEISRYPEYLASNKCHLCYLYKKQGEITRAIKNCKNALQVFEDINSNSKYFAIAHFELIELYARQRNLEKSFYHQNQLSKLREKQVLSSDYIISFWKPKFHNGVCECEKMKSIWGRIAMDSKHNCIEECCNMSENSDIYYKWENQGLVKCSVDK